MAREVVQHDEIVFVHPPVGPPVFECRQLAVAFDALNELSVFMAAAILDPL